MSTDAEAKGTHCPICGEGTLADIAYDALPPTPRDPEQQPDSRQIDSYTCGHQVIGGQLAGADATDLDVERRTSDEPAAPLPDDGNT
jgi:hypothetical protein